MMRYICGFSKLNITKDYFTYIQLHWRDQNDVIKTVGLHGLYKQISAL